MSVQGNAGPVTTTVSMSQPITVSSTAGGFKYAGLTLRQYKSGDHWPSFKTEFQAEMELADIRPSMQLAYLRRSIPEEGGRLLQHCQVQTLTSAFETLDGLFYPRRDLIDVQRDFLSIKQEQGEKLASLVGRLCVAAQEYELVLGHLTGSRRDDLVKEQFKRALTSSQVRDRLIDVEVSQITLADLLAKAQKLESYFAEQEVVQSHKGNRALRGVLGYEAPSAPQDSSRLDYSSQPPETAFQQNIATQLAELQAQLASLKVRQFSRGTSQFKGNCFNCGEAGHLVRECKQAKDRARITSARDVYMANKGPRPNPPNGGKPQDHLN